MPIIRWLHYADHGVALLCRSRNGSIWAIINTLDKTIAYPIEMQLYLSDPRLLLALILLIVTLLLDKLIPIKESKESKGSE